MTAPGSATEINWEHLTTHKCVCVYGRMHVNTDVCDPTLPACKRWISMEMDCEPAGKPSNYDVAGSKVRAVFKK